MVAEAGCLLLALVLLVATTVSADHNGTNHGGRFPRQDSDIYFPDEFDDLSQNNPECRTPEGIAGSCRAFSNCQRAQDDYYNDGKVPYICEYQEYETIVCCAKESEPIVPSGCGISNDNNPMIAMSRKKRSMVAYAKPQVVGGVTSQPNAWPWMAVMANRDSKGRRQWICGGCLISERYVLTAAHCATEEPYLIRLGEQNLNSDQDGAQPQDVNIERVTIHPEYQYPSLENDIALIRLARIIVSSFNIRPVCLPPPDMGNLEGQWATLTGYGRTSFVGDPSDTLQQVDVKIFNQARCAQSYDNVPEVAMNFPDGITNTQFCAGVDEGGKDSCTGDSGGPLVYQDRRTQTWTVIGIVSAGLGCGFANYPGVYTRVSKYMNDFINPNIRP